MQCRLSRMCPCQWGYSFGSGPALCSDPRSSRHLIECLWVGAGSSSKIANRNLQRSVASFDCSSSMSFGLGSVTAAPLPAGSILAAILWHLWSWTIYLYLWRCQTPMALSLLSHLFSSPRQPSSIMGLGRKLSLSGSPTNLALRSFASRLVIASRRWRARGSLRRCFGYHRCFYQMWWALAVFFHGYCLLLSSLPQPPN